MEISEAIEKLKTILKEPTGKKALYIDGKWVSFGICKAEKEAIEKVLESLERRKEIIKELEKEKRELTTCLLHDNVHKDVIRARLEELIKEPSMIVGGGRSYGKTLVLGMKLGKIEAYEELLKV